MQHSIFTLEEKSEYSIHAIFCFYFEEEDKDIKKLIILTYATREKLVFKSYSSNFGLNTCILYHLEYNLISL